MRTINLSDYTAMEREGDNKRDGGKVEREG